MLIAFQLEFIWKIKYEVNINALQISAVFTVISTHIDRVIRQIW